MTASANALSGMQIKRVGDVLNREVTIDLNILVMCFVIYPI